MKTYLRGAMNQRRCKKLFRSQLALKFFGAIALWCITSCCVAAVLYDNLGNVRASTDRVVGLNARGIRFTTDSAIYNALAATLPMYADQSSGPATLVLYSD